MYTYTATTIGSSCSKTQGLKHTGFGFAHSEKSTINLHYWSMCMIPALNKLGY